MNTPIRLTQPISASDHVQGPANAPLQLVEYGDYECPYCVRAHSIVQGLRESLKDDLVYVYRHFPLMELHPHSLDAARAAEAASRQGEDLFWKMHGTLIDNRANLESDELFDYAAAIGLDVARFERDFRNPGNEARVLAELQKGAATGVNGTPTFFINGFRYDRPWSYESLLQFLQLLLKEPSAKVQRNAA